MIFISIIAYSSKVNPVSIQQLNGLLFDECRRNGFKFVDNGAVSGIDLRTDSIHLFIYLFYLFILYLKLTCI